MFLYIFMHIYAMLYPEIWYERNCMCFLLAMDALVMWFWDPDLYCTIASQTVSMYQWSLLMFGFTPLLRTEASFGNISNLSEKFLKWLEARDLNSRFWVEHRPREPFIPHIFPWNPLECAQVDGRTIRLVKTALASLDKNAIRTGSQQHTLLTWQHW